MANRAYIYRPSLLDQRRDQPPHSNINDPSCLPVYIASLQNHHPTKLWSKMSCTVLARQPLMRCSISSHLRAAHLGVASTARRTIQTQPPQQQATGRAAWPLKTLSGGLVAAGSGWYLASSPSSPEARSFSIHSPLESASSSASNGGGDGKEITGSSTLIRPASPAAPRRQTVTLVFLTSESTSKGALKSIMSNFGGGGGEREKWYSWIGYFREAGYDCLQMNLALPPSTSSSGQAETTSKLADELHTQIRLSNLQRQPVLFVHHSNDTSPAATANIVSRYIEPKQSGGGGGAGGLLSKIFGGGGMFGGRPAISGLVVVSDTDDASALELFAKHPKLNTLIVANGGAKTAGKQGKVTLLDTSGGSHEKVIKEIERWLIKEGYEG